MPGGRLHADPAAVSVLRSISGSGRTWAGAGHLPSFQSLLHSAASLRSMRAHTAFSAGPGRVVFLARRLGLRVCKRHPTHSLQSGLSFSPGCRLSLHLHRPFLLHYHLPLFSHLKGGWAPLCLFWFFVQAELQTLHSADSWRQTHQKTTAQLQMSLPRWKVEGQRCFGGDLSCPPLTRGQEFPSREEKEKKKTGRRIEYILSQQLSLPSHLHFPNCKFFLCKYFLLKPLEKSFTHGVKYILSNVNQEAINTVLRTR